MNKREWDLSTHNLRELFKEFAEQGATCDRIVKYKFGLQYNPMFGFYHLWNGVSQNTMATLKLGERSNIIRYRPNSFYRYELFKFKIPNRESIFVPSENLSNHRPWVRHRLQDRIRRQMHEVNSSFLEQEGILSGTVLYIPLMLNTPSQSTASGSSLVHPSLTSLTLRVLFSTSQELQDLSEHVKARVQWLHTRGAFDGMPMEMDTDSYSGTHISLPYVELETMFYHYENMLLERQRNESYQRQAIEQLNNQLNSYQSNSTANTYYGRAVEQVMQEVRENVTSPVHEYTEAMMMSAVERLDEQNVPRERSTWDVWRRNSNG